MATLKTYRLSNNKLNTNCYIVLDYIKSEDELFSLTGKKILSTNIDNVANFTRNLSEYELYNTNGVRKNTRKNYGIVLTFLLDKEQKEEKITDLVNEIVKKYENLPFVSWIFKKGQGNYLKIYFSERYYYPNGEFFTKVAKKDIYKSALTGRACMKDEPGAYIWRNKGAVISETVSRFSSKARVFRFASEEQFITEMNKLKEFFLDLCSKIFKTVVETGITFKKYVLCILSSNQKGIARLWHGALNHMEDLFKSAYDSLDNTGYLPDARKELDSIFIKYNTMMHSNMNFYDEGTKFYIPLTYGKLKFKIDFNNTYIQTKADAELLEERFTEELNKIVFKYLPPIQM